MARKTNAEVRNLTKLKIAQAVRSLDQTALEAVLALAEALHAQGHVIEKK